MIAPAFYWDFGPSSPVNVLPAAMICANLDRLEVYVGGEHFATVRPDTAGYPHLGYPPFERHNARPRSADLDPGLRKELSAYYASFDDRLAEWLGRELAWRR